MADKEIYQTFMRISKLLVEHVRYEVIDLKAETLHTIWAVGP